MDSPAIRVEGLGKRFELGEARRTGNLRESLSDAAAALFRRRRRPRGTDHIWALWDLSFDVAEGSARARLSLAPLQFAVGGLQPRDLLPSLDLLQRVVGRGRALDLILSGDMIDAAEAHRIGLANKVVPVAELRDAIDGYVKTLASKSPMAIARSIEAIGSGGETSQNEAMVLEAGLFGLCFSTEDMKEGTAAFLEKRKADFPGR